jgi:hypothetical protein
MIFKSKFQNVKEREKKQSKSNIQKKNPDPLVKKLLKMGKNIMTLPLLISFLTSLYDSG